MSLIDRFQRYRNRRRQARIDAVCGGWSGRAHWKFFRDVFARLPIRDICIIGVYQGRDIAYMVDALGQQGRDDFRIVGVDLFEDVPGADWRDDDRDLSWEEAGLGPAPTIELARANLEKLGYAGRVALQKGSAIDFLNQQRDAFDLIYIDIAHDYESTRDAISSSMHAIRKGGFLCGDDYSDQGTWGVKRGVDEAFAEPRVFYDWIWIAEAAEYRL